MSATIDWHQRQRTIFLIASGISTAGSFAGLTAKGWILMSGTQNAMLLALHFAALSLPTLLVSGPAGVRTDRIGCEKVLVQAQWALLGAGLLGAMAIPLLTGAAQVIVLMTSTLLMGVAGAYELTARNSTAPCWWKNPNSWLHTSRVFQWCSTWASWWARPWGAGWWP